MNKKIKVGILGFGRAGLGMHYTELMNYKDKFEVVAIADHDPARLETVPESIKRYSNCDALLADPEVDFVSIALRHQEHTPYAIKALEAGKYVQVDKPIAVNYAEAKKLVACAAKHPGKLFPRQNRRFEGSFQKVLHLIDTGVLGKISLIKHYRSCGYARRNDWMTMTEFAGGLLTNWGPHVLDHALQYLASPVTDVWADVRRVVSIGDGDDQIKILLRAKNGMVADLEISGCNTLPGREVEIWGERGTLVYDPKDSFILMRYVDPECKFKKLKPHPENPPMQYGNFDETLTFIEQRVEFLQVPMHAIWKHIYDSITGKAPFPVKIEEALEVVRVTDLCFKAAGLPIPK